MYYFRQTFTIHPVGQGLFYSGLIHAVFPGRGSSHFSMVYDCGSIDRSHAIEEAALFRDIALGSSGDRLGLLVVSHFDADHVNAIGQLLKDRKIDVLVLPFTSFVERLFLVLRQVQAKAASRNPDDDFAIRFALDPIGTLGDNLDGNSSIYFVQGDPEPPPSPAEQVTDNPSEEEENQGFRFEFDGPSTTLDEADIAEFRLEEDQKDRVKKVKDSVPGLLRRGKLLKLMEFILYKINIGTNERAFYEKVFSLFCAKNGLPANVSLDEVIEVVKKIRGATIIKEIFAEAKDKVKGIDLGKSKLKNLNTTALCMMHINLDALYRLFAPVEQRWNAYSADIHKYNGTDNTRRKVEHRDFYWHFPGIVQARLLNRTLPNVLLTSDSFLRDIPDVTAFYNKYQSRWNSFWLFQVPHHGSGYNADDQLFSLFDHHVECFINYGVKNRDGHPSPEVIQALSTKSRISSNIPVHELVGLEFTVELHS